MKDLKTSVSFIFIFYFFTILTCKSQITISQQNSIGGSGSDFGRSIVAGKHNAYALSGYSNSSDGDLSSNKGGMDFLVSILDSTLHTQWIKSYGGSNNDIAFSIAPCQGGGYIIGGFSESADGDIPANKGGTDCILMRIDSMGQIIWIKNYGGSANDGNIALSVIETKNHHFIVCTNTSSTDGDLSSSKGGTDFWVFQTDSMGNLLWERTYGGSKNEDGHTILETKHGDFIIVGHSTSDDGDLNQNMGGEDFCMLKIDSSGTLLWAKTYGGSSDDVAYHITLTTDNGFIACGSTNSTDGDIQMNHGLDDCWILKLDSMGNLMWEKTLGGSMSEYAMNIANHSSGYRISAYSQSADGEVTANNGNTDFWVIQIDSLGNIVSQNNFGGSGIDMVMSSYQNKEHEQILVGFTNSTDKDVNQNKGGMDCWVIKLKDNISVDIATKNTFAKEKEYQSYYDSFNQEIVIFRKELLSNQEYKILLTDITGKIITQKNIENKISISATHLKKGVYLYKIFSDTEPIESGKIIIR